jgi:membrane-bound serine protease (ClpP class)
MRLLARSFRPTAGLIPVAAALVCLLSPAGSAQAQPEGGLFVTVPNPITSEAVNRIKSQVDTRRHNKERRVARVVFDFNPDGKPAATTTFGPCSDLAGYIDSLRDVHTVAFVHAKVSAHTVLPVLACKELVMGRAASIGEVAAEGVPQINDFQLLAYRTIGGREALAPVVQKMYDPAVRLGVGVNVKHGNATWFVDRRSDAEVKAEGVVGIKDVDFAQPGQLGLYTADQARELGLSKWTADTRPEVAELYGIPPSDLRDDVLQGRTPEAFRYTLKGEVDGAMRESVNRIIRDVRTRKGNVLILTLECGGGDLVAARALADDLRNAQQGDEAVMIVAFIPDQAPDAATFLALGCTDIVMSKRKDARDREDGQEATIGDFEAVIKAGRAGAAHTHRESLKELARAQGYPEILIDGMFDRDLEIVRVSGVTDRTQRRLMSMADFEANKEKWTGPVTIKSKGQLLKLTATRAAEVGLARYTVDTRDPKEVYAIYGLKPDRVREATPGWLDRFAEFLRMPVVTVLLVVIGFTGLILELKVPGLTVPGIIAALCFILVFWAQSRFSGETFVLALLLFILGLALVGLEIFVLPGFGAPGIFGILCMLAGLGLATFERVPETSAEWGGLGVKVSQYLFGMIGACVLAFVIARFLPKVPYANRLLLAPPGEGPEAAEPVLPGATEAAGLLGAVGTTNTALRPAGVVRFGDKFVDVVSDGGFVPAGTRVQVIAVEGTRIVVKEV